MAGLAESLKYALYRTPVLDRMMAPSYPYKLDPGQLTATVELIDSTRDKGGSLAEVGVAKGDTSVFLLEHLRTRGDDRDLVLIDTFTGFTETSIEHEVSTRGKSPALFDKFRYGDEAIFARNIRRAGYRRFRTVKGDASEFDWSTVAPVGAVILDVDLYQPTIAVLHNVWPHLLPGGGVVVDDCLAGTAWDGSLQAYEEFLVEQGLEFERVGAKGGVVRKPLING